MSAVEPRPAHVAADRTEASWFGGRLRQMRLSRGITLRSFAKSVGVSEAYLSLIERGRMGPPSAEVSSRMARALETEVDVFLAAAGRISPDVASIILRRPAEMSRLLRLAEQWSETDWAEFESELVPSVSSQR